MSYFNSFQILGNLKRTPTLVETKQGRPMTTFSVVCQDKWYKDGEEETHLNWFMCRAYGKTAVNICKYLDQGCKVLVTGKMRHEQWKDDDGNSRQRILFIVDVIKFLTTKNTRDRSSRDLEYPEMETCKKEDTPQGIAS